MNLGSLTGFSLAGLRIFEELLEVEYLVRSSCKIFTFAKNLDNLKNLK